MRPAISSPPLVPRPHGGDPADAAAPLVDQWGQGSFGSRRGNVLAFARPSVLKARLLHLYGILPDIRLHPLTQSVAQCLEVDVASQGGTLEQAKDNLAEALALHFEDQEVDVGEAPVIMPIDVAV